MIRILDFRFWTLDLRKNTLALLFFLPAIFATQTLDLEDQVRTIAAELRCVVCQNLSVADSPSELAQQMRALVRERLAAGERPAQGGQDFVDRYGERDPLSPT